MMTDLERPLTNVLSEARISRCVAGRDIGADQRDTNLHVSEARKGCLVSLV
jgi:hypothetical protein